MSRLLVLGRQVRAALPLLFKSHAAGHREVIPVAGQRIEFLSDALTDKGPATGEIAEVKTTVDGYYVVVKFADGGQATISWDEMEAAGADVRAGLWMVKSHPALFPGPRSKAQAEAGNYAKRRLPWRGAVLRIENEAGTIRTGPGWERRMLFPYGEMERTEGNDGDRVDVYVGPNLEGAQFVYVVHQRQCGDWDEYDEDKCMVGFDSLDEATTAYLAHYDDPRFLGDVTVLPVDEFVRRALATEAEPGMIKAVRFGDADLLKATMKKTITVPGYTKKDGTFVPPHQKQVHYNDEHTFEAVATGGVSHSQKQAHKDLSGQEWWQGLSMDDKALHVMALATDKQDAASASAAISGWKAAAKAGKNPSPAQWAAFEALPKLKQAPLWDEAQKAAGGLGHLKQPSAHPAPAPAPAATPAPSPAPSVNKVAEQMGAKVTPIPDPFTPAAPAPAPEATPEPEPKTPAPKLDNAAAEVALAAIPEKGSFYQKAALEKLKQKHLGKWKQFSAGTQHAMVMELYTQLQGAASAAAAVSMFKKAMLAGKVPSPAMISAYNAMDSAKGLKVSGEIMSAIGAAKYDELYQKGMAAIGAAATKAKPGVDPVPKPLLRKPGKPAVADPPAPAGAPPLAVGHALIASHGLLGGSATQSLLNLALTGHKDLPAMVAQIPASKKKTKEFGAALVKLSEGVSKVAAVKHLDPSDKLALVSWAVQLAGGADPDESAWKVFSGLEEGAQNHLVGTVLMSAKTTDGVNKFLKPKQLAAAAAKGSAEAAAAIASGPKAIVAPKTTYHHTSDGHNKSWSVHVAGDVLVTEFGPIGKKQQVSKKGFASHASALAAAEKIKAEKLGKGYYKHSHDPTHIAEVSAQAAAAVPKPAPVMQFFPPSGGDAKISHSGSGFEVATSYQGMPLQVQKFGSAKEAHGYVTKVLGVPPDKVDLAAVKKLGPDGVAGGKAGPQNGDTKPGKGGTLVFKDGHWHLMVPMKEAETLVAPMIATIPSLQHKKWIHAAVEMAANGDAAGIQSMMKHAGVQGSPKTTQALQVLLNKVQSEAGPIAAAPVANSGPVPAGKKMEKIHAAAAAAAAEPPPATPKNAPVVGKHKPGEPAPMDTWQQTGPQQGSNAGGRFKDPHGQEWYCKFPGDENVARNEFLAAKFYQMLGFPVPNLRLVSKGGKLGVASKWTDGLKKVDAATLKKTKGVHEGFVVDAWLGNWDVVGASNDNLLIGPKGPIRVDVGGSLVYRAQGAKKADFGNDVPELETMLNASKNPKAAAVFAGIDKNAMAAGIRQLNKLKPSQIQELVEKIGPGDKAGKDKLAATLIARRKYILDKFGVADQWEQVKVLDPTALPVNPKDLPAPIDFQGMNGGKGLSSKAHVNAQNTKDSAALIDFAAKGNLVGLKDYKYEAVDKETGASQGKKSVINHPSSHLKEQWAGLVELLQSIATPPVEALDMPSIGAAGSLEEISDFVGAFSPTERPETVSAEHRMGFFMAIGQIDDVHDLLGGLQWSFLPKGGAWIQKMKAGFKGIAANVKAYVHAVQDSGWVNHIWAQGKKTVDVSSHGFSYSGGVHTLAKQIYDNAVDIPVGTTLRRGMSDTTAGKQMTKLLLGAKPGMVLQNTDSMCTSYNEGHSWGGDVQMVIRCGPGVKATPSFASGRFNSEHEITTLPGQRFVVLSTEKTPSGCKLEVLALPPHEGYLAELSKLSALGKALQSVFLIRRRGA